jgi:hypothetical protein
MQVSVRYSRRLADKIVIAAKMACQENDGEVASLLIDILELAMTRPSPDGHRNRRKNLEALIELRTALAHLQAGHPPVGRGDRPAATAEHVPDEA